MSLSNSGLYGVKLAIKIQTATQWASDTTQLLAGELGIESDTGRMKVGNGSKKWSQLSYLDAGILNEIADIKTRLTTIESNLASLNELAGAQLSYLNAWTSKLEKEEM